MRAIRGSIIGGAGRLLAGAFGDAPLPAGFRPKSILVIKTCCIGDVLMATPTLAALRQAFPESVISLVVGSWSRAAVEGNPDVDEIIDCGNIAGGRSLAIGEYSRLVRLLRKRRFDCCFALERSPLLTAIPWLAGIPVRIGLDSSGRGFSLTLRVPVVDRRHEAELYLDTLRKIGYEPQGPRLRFFPSAQDHSVAGRVLAPLGTAPLVAMLPGGGVNPGMNLLAKRWPPERYAAIADRLTALGYKVLVIGALSDGDVVDAVKRRMRSDATVLVGQLSLGELGAVLNRCRLALANDSGPMHLAAAVGTPVVAIFGPSDPAVYGPYGQEGAVARSDLECSPCFKHGWAPPCPEPRCMSSLSVEAVWALVQARLDEPAVQPAAWASTQYEWEG